jgi:ABC-type glycerol-3-phosphate transport system permease component
MLAMALVVLAPIYFILVTSLKGRDEYAVDRWGLPSPPTLENFIALMERERLFAWLTNSLVVSVASVALTILVASLAAYSFARLRPPGRRVAFTGVTSLLVLSPVILVIPLFRTMVSLGLISQVASVILIYVGVMLPVTIYLLTNFYRSIPDELVDAAVVDGCGTFGVYRRIMLPLSAPAIVTASLLVWLYVWNEILIAIVFLQSDGARTLMAGLALFKGKYTTDIPLTMAGVVIAIIPTLIVYIVGQRYFVRGMTQGALK